MMPQADAGMHGLRKGMIFNELARVGPKQLDPTVIGSLTMKKEGMEWNGNGTEWNGME